MIRCGILTIVVVAGLAATVTADDPPAVQLKTLQFRVVDPDGKPVPAAQVKPWALRFGDAHGGWPIDRFGDPKLTKTDDNGLTTIDHPPSVGGDKVSTVSVFIDHPDYCVKNVEVPVTGTIGAPSNVSLERGTKLRVQAVDAATLDPVTDPHIQFLSYSVTRPIDGSGHFRKADGEAGKAGWYESRQLPGDASPLFVIALRDDDVPQFSRIHRWTPGEPLSHLIIASVDTGCRFEGMVDLAVPRPIKNGRVVGCATTPVGVGQRASSMVWTDIVPLNEDGSFLFPSLPRDCDVQVFALCEGWRSALPDPDDAQRMSEKYNSQVTPTPTFASGQSWLLAGDQVKATLKMARTATVRIRCLNADGAPLVGADVGFFPNHYIYGGGSQIFAQSYRSADVLRMGPAAFRHRPDRHYSGQTDANGWVTISNLPPGRNQFGVGGHRVINGDDEYGVAEADTDKVVETTVRVAPQAD